MKTPSPFSVLTAGGMAQYDCWPSIRDNPSVDQWRTSVVNLRPFLWVQVLNQLVPLIHDDHQLVQKEFLAAFLRLSFLPVWNEKEREKVQFNTCALRGGLHGIFRCAAPLQGGPCWKNGRLQGREAPEGGRMS